jgi:hypothetical protein
MTLLLKKWNLALPLGILSALLVLGIAAAIYLFSPSNYFAMDVNPSVEIQTNRLNMVVSVTPVNDDAKKLLAGYELTDKNLEAVIKSIVDRMILNGYIAPTKDNQILVTSLDKNAGEQLTQNVDSIITSYLSEKKLNATVLEQAIVASPEDIKNAHESKVSPGKMALIQKLLKADSSLTLADLSKKRVSDLVHMAQAKNIHLGNSGKVAPPSTTPAALQIDIKTADEQDKDDEQVGVKITVDQDKNDDQDEIKDADDKDKDDDQDKIENKNEKDKNDKYGYIKNAGKHAGKVKQNAAKK